MQSHPFPPPKTSQKVAVIGAGSAGLVAARELHRAGHQVVVFERTTTPGGIWVYNPSTESDPLSINPSRSIIHTSLYNSLRTNLPREVMGFRDYPFITKDDEHRDSRRFPGHKEVLLYLNDFVSEFGLSELIRFETEVVRVEFVEERKWTVRFKRGVGGSVDDEVYNAVVVCNGHYTMPRIAEIPGIDAWPGEQIHSHNYRVPDPFCKKVVVLIGSSASAYDISRDIAIVAKEVHVASRSFRGETPTIQYGYNNLWTHSMIKNAHEDGTIVFQDGSSIPADIILHCTGYKYDFPFLETNNIVNVDDNRVGPLYQHVFPPQLAPWLSFIGLPWKVIPFPLCELQSKWVAGILSGQFTLPSQEEMMSDVETFYANLEKAGVPKRYTHNMDSYQFEYDDWLAAQCGVPLSEEWRKEMYMANRRNRVIRPENYRDEWEDQDLVLLARQDFVKYNV
ncbi:hypothetical protein ACHQM5_001339 [Ranunculus cassubicifolius]